LDGEIPDDDSPPIRQGEALRSSRRSWVLVPNLSHLLGAGLEKRRERIADARDDHNRKSDGAFRSEDEHTGVSA